MAANTAPANTVMVEASRAFRCEDCEVISEPEDMDSPLYECEGCGTRFTKDDFTGTRCPECNKFASKVAEHGCPECGEGECQEVYVVDSIDDEKVAVSV